MCVTGYESWARGLVDTRVDSVEVVRVIFVREKSDDCDTMAEVCLG